MLNIESGKHDNLNLKYLKNQYLEVPLLTQKAGKRAAEQMNPKSKNEVMTQIMRAPF